MNTANPATMSSSSESPLGFSREGEVVTVRMSFDDWENLLLALGYAAGGARQGGRERHFWQLIDLTNRLNVGNSAFTPYEVPEQFRQSRQAGETGKVPNVKGGTV